MKIIDNLDKDERIAKFLDGMPLIAIPVIMLVYPFIVIFQGLAASILWNALVSPTWDIREVSIKECAVAMFIFGAANVLLDRRSDRTFKAALEMALTRPLVLVILGGWLSFFVT